jgi:hypothetical protein
METDCVLEDFWTGVRLALEDEEQKPEANDRGSGKAADLEAGEREPRRKRGAPGAGDGNPHALYLSAKQDRALSGEFTDALGFS